MILRVPSNFKEVSPGILEWYLEQFKQRKSVNPEPHANGTEWATTIDQFTTKTVALKVDGKCYIPR